MSLIGRINELSNKHSELETKISEEQKRPAADTLALKQLKQKKLRIKEELRLLKTG